jgi:hypothetical protein
MPVFHESLRFTSVVKYQTYAGDWILKNSKRRYELIATRLSRASPDIGKEGIMDLLSKEIYDGVCGHYYTDYFGTLFSIIYDLTDYVRLGDRIPNGLRVEEPHAAAGAIHPVGPIAGSGDGGYDPVRAERNNLPDHAGVSHIEVAGAVHADAGYETGKSRVAAEAVQRVGLAGFAGDG